MIDGNHAGHDANVKNVISKLRYWQSSRFATWSLPAIHDWDLIEWRGDVLDEDLAEDRARSVRMPSDRRRPSFTGSTRCRS
jgi:hypothetical protein